MALTTVRGMNVALHVACWSYERYGAFRGFYEDPEAEEPGLDLEISPEEFAAEYYTPISEIVETALPLNSNDQETVTYALPGLDLRLALHRKLDALIREPDHLEGWLGVLPHVAQQRIVIDDDAQLGPDGLAVLPGDSWRRAGTL